MSRDRLMKTVGRMQVIKGKVQHVWSLSKNNCDMLTKKATKSTNDIKELRGIINGKLDVMENKACKAINESKKASLSNLRENVAACETIQKQINESLREIQECQSSKNKELIFIALEKSSCKVGEMEKVAAEVESEASNWEFTFQPKKLVEEFLHQVRDLGQDIDASQITTVSSRDEALETMISKKQYIKINSSWISGLTFLPSGGLVLCDHDKHKLSLYNSTITSKKSVDLPSRPWDVCTVSDCEVAVTLTDTQKIQFVTVKPRLKLEKHLNVDRKCYGIDCHNSMMYVTCHDNPGNGEVLVMTMDGAVQMRLADDYQGQYMFSCPNYLRVSSSSGQIYVSDLYTHTVTCMSQHGDVLYLYNHKDLSNPHGIQLDSRGNVLVCGQCPHNIHFVDKNGVHRSILAIAKDEIEYPWCLSYRDDGALAVGMKSKPACKV